MSWPGHSGSSVAKNNCSEFLLTRSTVGTRLLSYGNESHLKLRDIKQRTPLAKVKEMSGAPRLFPLLRSPRTGREILDQNFRS